MAQTDGPARFPGIPAIVDGSEAIAHVEVRISEGACAYPITPSTTMASLFQAAVADGRPNLWGTPLRFVEPESEHSSASAAEGFALSGGRVTNFTAGQGLILMKEVLYVIAGKRLPVVFHIGARALTSQALNIHAGHDDVMGVADTGWGILFARNAQEAADLTAVARRAAEATEIPFFVVQDGFLTTHTLEDVRLPEDELLRAFVGDPRDHVRDWFDPAEALMSGVVQNQDSYMKGRIGQRAFYDRLGPGLDEAMAAWTRLTGRDLGRIRTHRIEGAAHLVVSMGTIADTAEAVVDRLRDQGRAVGSVAVTSYRPFPAEELAQALAGAAAVAVVERTDEPAAAENPLARETKAALADLAADGRGIPRVLSVSAGLGSRDVGLGDLAAVFDRLALPAAEGHASRAVLGIRHRDALATKPFAWRPRGAYSLRGHSIGGFGSVTTNRLLATIGGELFGLHVQAYPRYGSEKRGLPTTYFLTLAEERIQGHAELERVDLVAVHDASAFEQGDPLAGLEPGGTIFLPSGLGRPEAIWASLPTTVRATIVERDYRLVALDATGLAESHAPHPDLVRRMQGVALVGVFLRVAPFAARAGLGREALLGQAGARLDRFFGKKGPAVLAANRALITAAYDGLVDVTAAIADVSRTGAEPPRGGTADRHRALEPSALEVLR